MTALDPRVGEIEARLEPALVHAPYIRDGRRVIQANNHPSIRPYMLSDNSMPVIAEFIANAPADLAFLLAELRKAHEALERVEGLAGEFDRESEASDNVAAEVMKAPRTNAVREELRRHEQHAVIAHNHANRIRAAVAAAKGDERG